MRSVVMFLVEDIAFDGRVRKEATALAARGYHVTIVSHAGGRDPARDVALPPGVTLRELPMSTWRLPKGRVGGALKLLELTARSAIAGLTSGADVFHAHDLNTLVPAFVSAAVKRKKLVYDSHELWAVPRGIMLPLWPAWRRIERSLIHRADLVITVNAERADLIRAVHGLARAPLVVQNLPPRSAPRARRAGVLREAIGAPASARVVLHQGLVSDDRSPLELVAAARLLRDEGAFPDLRVVFLGTAHPEMRAALRRAIDDAGLAASVHMLDPVPHARLPDYVVGADVATVLFKGRNFNNVYCAPNKLYDSLMLGVPVLASSFRGLRRIVVTHDVGVCVDPEDPASIAGGLREMLSDPARLSERGRNARRLAEEALNWEAEATRLGDAYAALHGADEEAR